MSEALSRSRTRVAGFADPELDFQLLRQLGSANYGGATVGGTLAAAAEVGDGGPPAWVSVFTARGDQQRQDADARAAAGHQASAAGQYLVACNSYRAAEYFAVVGSEEHRRLGAASERAFARSLELSGRAYERVHITVDGLRLPGYWFDAPGPRGTGRILVATSGFDGTTEETYLQVGRAAVERGWQVLLIAGPGQADTARAYPDAPFVPDTERWIAPWIDAAADRSTSAPDRIALLGISFGGYFALRAAAADPRIGAVVANSPIVDLRAYLASFVGFDPEQAIPAAEDFGLSDIDGIPDATLPPSGKAMARSLIKRFGRPSFLSTFQYLKEFSVDPAAVSVPALAMVGEGEGPEPIAQFERFVAGAGGPVSERRFTMAEGADTHCQLGNLPLSNAVLFDWLDDTLA
ncbi:MAG: alpha/beta hydrolase family protein [Candidatus Dormibacteraceae bacterium]